MVTLGNFYCTAFSILENRICRQIQDLHASFGIKERRKHCSRSCIYPLYTRRLKLSSYWLYHVSKGRSFRDTGWLFKFPYLGMKSGFEEMSQSCIWCTLFLPHGVEIKLIFALRAAVFKIRADFQISIFGHEGWNLKKGPKAKVAYVVSFYPRGSKLSLFSLYGQSFSRYRLIFKISIFGHEIRNLKTGPKVAYVLSFYPRGSKLSLFWLYGQPFSRYGLIFQISIYGHEMWNLKTGPKVAYVLSFYPKGAEIKLIFALRASVFEIEQFKP